MVVGAPRAPPGAPTPSADAAEDPIGEPPDKLGFGRLDPSSVRVAPNGWSADYLMDGHVVHRVQGEGERWSLECFHRGTALAFTRQPSPAKVCTHHFVFLDMTRDPRAAGLRPVGAKTSRASPEPRGLDGEKREA